ncbi:hypothetical protein CE91St62_05490 [Lachnospiraceae bacterium]|nr:hypothetical protein CE91St61_05530 [Lachnospiraceae bacterium]BDF36488.1 hypothetical protein CE91St62_05490 [Lachnospiraceae bacterium]
MHNNECIANAVSNAVGTQFYKLPIRPENVLEALKEIQVKRMKQSELCITNKARVRVEKRFLFDYNIA